MTDTELISQTVLDTLENRVCAPLGHYIVGDYEKLGSSFWGLPIQELRKIETDPFRVYGIIKEYRKNLSIRINLSDSRFRLYQVLFTRIYILVCYRHYGEEIYNTIVLKALASNMGMFGTEEAQQRIHNDIGEIKALEKKVEAAKAEKPADGNTTAQEPANRNTTTEESAEDALQEGEKELQNIKFHNKVRLDLLLKLMLKAGANLTDHGNKRRAAEVMAVLSGLPLNTCKNFCSDPVVNQDTHEEALDALKKKLQILDINLNIETNSPKQHSGDGTTPREQNATDRGTPEG